MKNDMTNKGIHERVVEWFSMNFDGDSRLNSKSEWVTSVMKGFGRDKPTTHDYDIVIAIMELINELPSSHGMTSVSKILTGKAKTCTKNRYFGMLMGIKEFSQAKVLKLCFEVESYLDGLGAIKRNYDYNDGQSYDAMRKDTDELTIYLLVELARETKDLFAISAEAPVKTAERSSMEYKKAFMDYLPSQSELFLEEAEKILEDGDFGVRSDNYGQTHTEIYEIYKKREKMRFCSYGRSKKKGGSSCSVTLDLCFFKKDSVERRTNNGSSWNDYGYLGALKLIVDIDDELNVSNPRIELKKISSHTDLWTGVFVLEFAKKEASQ